MKGLRSTIVLLIVLAGLGGYVYYLSSKPETPASQQEMQVGRDLTLASDLKMRPPLVGSTQLAGEYSRMTDAQKVA